MVNNNYKHLDKMVNSINSFYHHNPELSKETQLFIISNEKELHFDPVLLHPDANYALVNNLSYNYEKLNRVDNKDWPVQIYFRYELFVNKSFQDFDNVLYLDCDT